MAHSTAAVAPTAGVRERLVELRALAHELLPRDSLADLDDAIARLDGVRCNVAMLGEFKRGKSTLVNALIEHAVLPTDVLPLTAAITVVRTARALGSWWVTPTATSRRSLLHAEQLGHRLW